MRYDSFNKTSSAEYTVNMASFAGALPGISTSIVRPRDNFVYQIEAESADLRLDDWLKAHSSALKTKLLEHGALFLRGFKTEKANLPQYLEVITGRPPLDYLHGTSPRTEAGRRGVYYSTFAPPGSVLAQHQELSYQKSWPSHILFYCARPADNGGETPLSNMRRFMQDIPPEILRLFRKKRSITYGRAFIPGLGQSWQQSFATKSREKVSEMCRQRAVSHRWAMGGLALLTKHSAQTLAQHPETGEEIWFNQVIGSNFYSPGKGRLSPQFELLEPGLPFYARPLLKHFSREWLPYSAYFDDNSDIPEPMLRTVCETLERDKLSIPWKKGDIIIADNMLTAHGRNAFKGKREVLAVLS